MTAVYVSALTTPMTVVNTTTLLGLPVVLDQDNVFPPTPPLNVMDTTRSDAGFVAMPHE